MSHNLISQIQDLFENGLINVLKAIPGNFPERERLAIESVVFTAYGYYRVYRRLEALLIAHTSDEGNLTADIGVRRDIFADLWSLVDSAYALGKISTIKPHKNFLKLSDETRQSIWAATKLRNFMDHPAQQFENAVKAAGWFPLFGLATYQLTPCARNPRLPHNVIYMIGIASTHLRGSTNIEARDHTRASAVSEIDRITLHLKKNDSCNLSQLMADLAIDISNYSLGIHTYIFNVIQKPENQTSGLQIPFTHFTVKADLHDQQVVLAELKSELDEHKMRFEIEINS